VSGKRYQGFGEEHNWTHIPYAKSLILMHNIDVMHQESNFCQALINTERAGVGDFEDA
jgi:hypothetical protein